MKIVTLNLWGGRIYRPLMEFFEKYQDVDIFCLQEIYHQGTDKETEFKEEVSVELFNEIQQLLPNHTGFFRPHWEDFWGLAMFVKKDVEVLEEGEIFVHKWRGWKSEENKNFVPKNIQYIRTKHKDSDLTIVNFHGHWNGKGKTDTEDRLTQSENVINFLRDEKGQVVLCGDFNLLPETQSLKKFENFGLKNLIKEYGITSTRTSHYKKETKFADYIFLSPNMPVVDFKVMDEEVSDHSALYLEI